MRIQYLVCGITLLMLTGTVSAAENRTKQVHCKGGGTFTDGVETHIDSNGDGVSATLSQGAETCNIANFVFQDETEFILQPSVSSACPAGTTHELRLGDGTTGQYRGVATDTDTGDQIFAKASATECYNASTGRFTIAGQVTIIGGTGKYADASGSATSSTTGSYLMGGFKDGVFGGFGQFTFTSDGTLTLPKK